MSVPALRFPEFEEEWRSEQLAELITAIDAGWSPSCKEQPAMQEEWGVLKTTAVVWSGYDDKQNKALPTKLTPRPKLETLAGDILITRAGPIDRVAVVAFVVQTRPNLMLSDKLMRFRSNKKNDGDFLARVLGTRKVQNYFSARKSGLAEAQANISQSILKKTPILAPTLPEQKKIAAFLGAVDARIAGARKRRDLLETYKRGLMQALFSRTLRFTTPDGTAFPDWEEKRLGDVADKPSYGMNAAAKPFDGKHQYIRITDIDERTRKFSPKPVTSPEGYIDESYRLRQGDILFARTGAGVGRSYRYVSTDGAVYFAGFLVRFRIKDANPDFIFAQTLTPQFQCWVLQVSMRSGQPGINAKEYSTFKFDLPHPDEQQKIADALSAMDAKIEAVAAQVAQLEAFKKGLLQQMFV